MAVTPFMATAAATSSDRVFQESMVAHQSPADPKLWHCATYVNDTCLRLPCSDPPGRWRNGRTATQRIGTCSIHVLKASAPAIRTNGAQLGLQHA
ncbi:hypothetical protein F443_07225 [Phytophthora nicotianae P1569]|uniref:Uncharacterized protein n=1 Tax=Phytophthora nicotianae P1569 TaxID=1317065 RepID=V9FCE5_PHYNI|nr:hypothetical protein F443_07225 [Phytophthora nicotianae P1569]